MTYVTERREYIYSGLLFVVMGVVMASSVKTGLLIVNGMD